ncbi:MAG: cysteine desulfurase family protein [Candidatus Saccharimonadales bacterium]
MASTIYLDYAAATPVSDEVFSAMKPYFSEAFYNPSALYEPAVLVRNAYEQARHDLAIAIGAKQHEIIVTAGASESINLALRGIIAEYGGYVACAGIEHLAVLETAKELGFQDIAVSEKGLVTADAVRQAITADTTIVSVGFINNELGTIQPLKDISEVVSFERQRRLRDGEQRPLLLHTDASQASGLIDCSVSRLGVDMMTLNAAKCYGPKQVGLLWVKAGLRLHPIVTGGSQELSIRAGTENVAGTVGFAYALSQATAMRKDESTRLAKLRDMLETGITSSITEAIVNGHNKRRAPHILHISVPGLDGERAVFALDQSGVLAATGSACAANSGLRSHVLIAAGFDDIHADGSLRFSLGRYTSQDEIEHAIPIIVEVITRELAL